MQSSRSFIIRSRAISDSAWITNVSFRMMVTVNTFAAHNQHNNVFSPGNDHSHCAPSATVRCFPARGGYASHISGMGPP
jgi:hypothetical protein